MSETSRVITEEAQPEHVSVADLFTAFNRVSAQLDSHHGNPTVQAAMRVVIAALEDVEKAVAIVRLGRTIDVARKTIDAARAELRVYGVDS